MRSYLGKALLVAGLGLAALGCNPIVNSEHCGEIKRNTRRNGKTEYFLFSQTSLRPDRQCVLMKYSDTYFLESYRSDNHMHVFLPIVGNEEDAKIMMQAYRRMAAEGSQREEALAVAACDKMVNVFDTCVKMEASKK